MDMKRAVELFNVACSINVTLTKNGAADQEDRRLVARYLRELADTDLPVEPKVEEPTIITPGDVGVA